MRSEGWVIWDMLMEGGAIVVAVCVAPFFLIGYALYRLSLKYQPGQRGYGVH